MKELLHQYASHNLWANQLLLKVINQLTPEQVQQPIASSFPSVFKTVLHMLDADTIWWQRLKLQEHIERPSETFSGDFNELQQRLVQQSALYEQWTGSLMEHQMMHVFAYQRSKTEQQKQPVYQTLLHVFNHATYHRGQLVTMLRQLGISNIPQTDYIAYLRQKK